MFGSNHGVFRSDITYVLIVDASTGTETVERGMGSIFTQIDKDGKFYGISFAAKHEKNYSMLGSNAHRISHPTLKPQVTCSLSL
jgi:uncharacterized protein YuzE